MTNGLSFVLNPGLFSKTANFGFINALYMTVIIVSMVGFEEAQPLDDDAGKLFILATKEQLNQMNEILGAG